MIRVRVSATGRNRACMIRARSRVAVHDFQSRPSSVRLRGVRMRCATRDAITDTTSQPCCGGGMYYHMRGLHRPLLMHHAACAARQHARAERPCSADLGRAGTARCTRCAHTGRPPRRGIGMLLSFIVMALYFHRLLAAKRRGHRQRVPAARAARAGRVRHHAAGRRRAHCAARERLCGRRGRGGRAAGGRGAVGRCQAACVSARCSA